MFYLCFTDVFVIRSSGYFVYAERLSLSAAHVDDGAEEKVWQLVHARVMDGVLGRDGVLPYFETGQVVKGFGRGSKEIGVPTGTYIHIACPTLV